MRNMIRNLTLTVVAIGLAGFASAAPTPLNAILSVDNATASGGGARVRVVHASPDAPNVDILVNDGVVFADLPFEQISDFAEVPAGTYNVKVVPAGATTPVVFEADLDLAGGTDYTVVATGLLGDSTFAPQILTADSMSGPASGQAWVRFFHGSADAPAVDIAVAGTDIILFADAPFRNTPAYLPVGAGTYDLEVRLAGTETVVLNLWGIALADGGVYTAYATGLVADGFADRTLYLNDDRFRVDVTWKDFQDRTGVGFQKALTDDTGYFWFFNPDNVELTLKVLDGTPINGNWWVFYGALSNVEYMITVTDTMTDSMKMYSNDLGDFGSVGDTAAFMGQ